MRLNENDTYIYIYVFKLLVLFFFLREKELVYIYVWMAFVLSVQKMCLASKHIKNMWSVVRFAQTTHKAHIAVLQCNAFKLNTTTLYTFCQRVLCMMWLFLNLAIFKPNIYPSTHALHYLCATFESLSKVYFSEPYDAIHLASVLRLLATLHGVHYVEYVHEF